MFEPNPDESFPVREERILQFWREKSTFLRSMEKREGSPLFSFYDGPPFATGLPHYGHLLAGTIKDVVPRYKTMRGFLVPRRFGWDCHGLPIENEIEKAQNLSGAASIEEFGISRFNEECRSIVLRYTEEWKTTVERMGRWVDFSKTYKTMDPSFMESVWWAFGKLYEKGLIYEGFKVMPFSTKLGTPLSNFEANLNYQEVDDPSATVAFAKKGEKGTYFLAWTTTPWTLPSNMALLVHPDILYAKVRQEDRLYIVAQAKVSTLFPNNPIVEEVVQGKELLGLEYEPLFPFFQDKQEEGAFRVVGESSVSMEEGTGIVHAAPAFGEVDFYACKRENVPLVCPVDSNGHFTQEVPPFAGQFVKSADKEILRHLKKEGKLFSQATIRHRYPFCWRSDTPLIYKTVATWFVAVETIKQELLDSNEPIHWVPGHIKYGRFGKWLENARDWAISRNRYWGTPIPIWRADDGEIHVIKSVQELEKLTQTKIVDLHRHFIDSLTFSKNGKLFRRIPEVFDCWFESGSMPYAQNHYPFQNEELFHKSFPGDFIAEGIDQTRAWFYTLNVLSSALFQKPAFQNVVVNGIILAEDGNKMSKRLRNYPDPQIVIEKYGADAIRLYMLGSPAVKGEDLRFSEKGVEHTLRQVLIPLWNSFVFLSTYAKIYNWKPYEIKKPPNALLDRWILSNLQKLLFDVESAMEKYDLSQAVEPFMGFIDSLTNWYIRRSRSRFWADEDTQDRQEAFATLYTTLLTLTKIAAPFIPFLSEAIYQELKKPSDEDSVHLSDFPSYNPSLRDEELEREVAAAQVAVSIGHTLRKAHQRKVRQPLQQAHILTQNEELLAALQKQTSLIADELNVKQVLFDTQEHRYVTWSCKPNFPILGKKLGAQMPQAQKALQQLPLDSLKKLSRGIPIEISLQGTPFLLQPEDVTILRQVKEGIAAENIGEITLVLDTTLTEELEEEGLARELINKINTMRRDAKLHVTDRIHITLVTTPKVRQAYKKFSALICHEVLATEVSFVEKAQEGTVWDLNGEKTQLALSLVY